MVLIRVMSISQVTDTYCSATTIVGEVDGVGLGHGADNGESKQSEGCLEGEHLVIATIVAQERC